MNNLLKSKTRLTFIQIIFVQLSTKKNIDEILETFIVNYKNTSIDNFNNNKKIKFEFNSNFLRKLIFFYSTFFKDQKKIFIKVNNQIDFNRKFENWDLINQSILLATISELNNINSNKVKITFNDYLNVSKFFIDKADIRVINAVVDKLINEK